MQDIIPVPTNIRTAPNYCNQYSDTTYNCNRLFAQNSLTAIKSHRSSSA